MVYKPEQKVTRKKDISRSAHATVEDRPAPIANSQPNYKQLFEYSDAIVFTHTLDGKLLQFSPSFCQYLGYTADEIAGVDLTSIVPVQFRDNFFETYLSTLRVENSAKGVLNFLSRYGKKKSLLFHCYLQWEKDLPPYGICLAMDMTDRTEQEESLKLSNETFRSAFDYSGIGMALISPQGNILDANNAVCNFTGYSKTELLQMNFLELTHAEDNKTDQGMLQKMLARVISHYSIEKRYISKSKKILWALHTVSKVAYNDGTPKFFILQIVDITRKKELTDELNLKNSELEATRTGLINKIGQLEELNYIVAHNLRGPANNITLLVDMLKNINNPENEDTLKLELEEIVSFLDEGASSLLGSLNTLMDVVQISMNKTIPYDECDAKKIVYDILNQLNSVIFEKNASIKGNLAVTNIRYPKVFLESIFYNLISNALKYSAKDRRPEIMVTTYSVDDRIVISVKDNGVGINLDKYGSKIFKLNQTFHTGYDSKGVGLFITKAQIESFGGSIKVKSRENEGSEFIVTL